MPFKARATDQLKPTVSLIVALIRVTLENHRRQFAVAMLATLLAAMADFLSLYVLLHLTRVAISAVEPDRLALYLAAIAGVVVGASGLRAVMMRWQDQLAIGVANTISKRLFSVMMRQDYDQHVGREHSAIAVRIEDARLIGLTVLLPLVSAVGSIVLAIGLVGALLLINWRVFAATAVLVTLAYWLVTALTGNRLRETSSRLTLLKRQRAKIVHEAQSGIRDLILTGSIGRAEAAFDQATTDAGALSLDVRRLVAIPKLVIEPVAIFVGIATLLVFVRAPGGIGVSLPMLAVLATGMIRLIQILNGLSTTWSQFHANAASLSDLLATTMRPRPLPPSVVPLPLRCSLVLDRVSVSYPSGVRALDRVSLMIAHGERIVILGASGTGKTTLLDLLAGLHSPETGAVVVDGQPLAELPDGLLRWRSSVAMVSQHLYLPDVTVAELIVGQGSARCDQRLAAAIDAGELSAWVAGLTDGVGTRLGEAGGLLSGGERQRLALARAFYREAPVVLLDEATGQLDARTERAIIDRLLGLDRDRTIVCVTHRESAVAGFDRVIRLDAGRIVSDRPMSTPTRHSVDAARR